MTITIELDEKNKIFYAGDVIKGKIVYDTSSKKKMVQSLKVKMCCLEIFEHAVMKNLSYQHTQFDKEITLLGGSDPEAPPNSIYLGQGKKEYPFIFQIPFQNPEDFYKGTIIAKVKDTFVYMVYSIKCLMKITEPEVKDEFDEVFFNVAPSLIKEDPIFDQEIQESQRHDLGVGGFLEIRCLQIKRGYRPGDTINPNFVINNYSDYPVSRIKCQLNRVIYFFDGMRWIKQSESIKSGIAPINCPPRSLDRNVKVSFNFSASAPSIYADGFIATYELECFVEHSGPNGVFSLSPLLICLSNNVEILDISKSTLHKEGLKNFQKIRRTVPKKTSSNIAIGNSPAQDPQMMNRYSDQQLASPMYGS